MQFDRKHDKTLIKLPEKILTNLYSVDNNNLIFFYSGFDVTYSHIYSVLAVFPLLINCRNPFPGKHHHQEDNFPEKSGSNSRFFGRIKDGSKNGERNS